VIKRAVTFLPTGLIAFLHILLLFPNFFAPYDYADQNRDFPFSPPTRLHFVDANGSFHARPFVYGWDEKALEKNLYLEDHQRIYPIQFLRRGSAYSIVGGWRGNLHLFGIDEPGRAFIFGTDDFGRDEFSRFLFGGRISLLAGAFASAIALLAGTLAGTLAGYYGKWTDAVLMRVLELFLALPWLYLLFAVRAALPLNIKTTDAFLLLVGIMGLVGWARPARLIRGLVLSARERTYVLAARSMGASDMQILRRHILPQTYPTILTMTALLIPQFILAEVTLSFLGLGVGEPIASWGNLLAELQKYSVLSSFWWMYLPGLGLVVLFLAYHLISARLQSKTSMVSP
jgi:peptide/nickel transport system permease protein